ncbi:MAG TPA: hypothetical protein VHG32_11980, partial [Thermoanaerobaculia bacterium]|nr:hypothetical protein [Thermoanaerobaculia bacterium]
MTATNGPIAARPWPRLAWAAAITACLLAVAWALQWVPLPGLNINAVAGQPLLHATTSVAALGINPLLTGFILVELFSFSPPGRRWRHGGPAGRARLNRAALAVSLVTAAVQATGMSIYLETMTDPFGLPLVFHPGFAFRILMVVTLAAATAALYALGAAIGEWGLGNGFCWLLALGIVQTMVGAWRFDPRFQRVAEPTEILFGALWLVPVIALVAWAELRRPAVAVAKAAGGTLAVQLPPLLQGVAPVAMAESVVVFLFAFPALSAATWFSQLELLFSLGGRLLLIPAFSLIAFALFASRKRLAANLRPAAAVAPAVEETLDRHLLGTTATLTAA